MRVAILCYGYGSRWLLVASPAHDMQLLSKKTLQLQENMLDASQKQMYLKLSKPRCADHIETRLTRHCLSS